MINDLNIAPTPPSTDLQRMLRNAQWRANLPFKQRPIYVFRNAKGVLSLQTASTVTGSTQVALIRPNRFYQSGQREEWRERWQQMGDRTY